MKFNTTLSALTLAMTAYSHSDILQYADCDGDGSLFLTGLNASPFVDLSGLDLRCADLSGASLSFAVLKGADLSFADLSNANLQNADLRDTNLYGANLSGTLYIGTSTVGDAVFIPPMTGSCCTSSGCAIVTENDCTNLGGFWTEAGSCGDCISNSGCTSDVTGDGVVDFSDLVNIINDWGLCP